MGAVLAGLVLTGLVLSAATTDRNRLSGAVFLGVFAILWLVVNRPMEGAILVVISPTKGFTAADPAGLAALAVAGWRIRAYVRDRRAGADDEPADAADGEDAGR